MNTTGRHSAGGAEINALPWRRSRPPARVLAIRLHALGDTVLTLPYLHALRRLLPDTTLDFLTRREVADIPKNVILFDRVFDIGGGRDPRRQWLSALTLVPRLSLQRYDVILDLQRNRLSRAIRILLNPRSWSEFDRFSPRLAGERTRATIEAAGLGPLEVRPDLVLRRKDMGSDKLRAAGWNGVSNLVVLNPAGAFPGRSWPLESYLRFAELWLAQVSRATQFVVLGLPALGTRARYLKARLGSRLLDLTGRTSPSEAFAVLQRAMLVLSEDSGLMHMAWVSGAPTLALFGASRSDWSRPHGNYSDCLRACQRAEGVCISDGHCHAGPPTCLQEVSPEAVVERARVLMRRVANEPRGIHPDGHPSAPEDR
ncbi:MAG TPA: glycosyltransferase family 9 protein [Longimicrobiales bacterium]